MGKFRKALPDLAVVIMIMLIFIKSTPAQNFTGVLEAIDRIEKKLNNALNKEKAARVAGDNELRGKIAKSAGKSGSSNCNATLDTMLMLFSQIDSSQKTSSNQVSHLSARLNTLDEIMSEISNRDANTQVVEMAKDLKTLIDTLKAALSKKGDEKTTLEKPKISISGKAYIHLSGDLSEKKNLKYDGFSIERTYVTIKSSLVKGISARVTMDINPKADDYKYIYLKYAYADFNYKFLKLRVGQQGTPWPGFADKAWKYRCIQKSLTDKNKMLASADIGLGLSMKLPNHIGEILLQGLNGGGYKNHEGVEESNFQKDIAARITLTPFTKHEATKGIALSSGAYFRIQEGSGIGTYTGLLSYKYSILTIGSEVAVETSEGKAKEIGVSVFGDIGVPKLEALGLLVRYDSFDPDKESMKDAESLLIIGPRYKIKKKHTAAIVYEQHDSDVPDTDPTRLVKAVLELKF